MAEERVIGRFVIAAVERSWLARLGLALALVVAATLVRLALAGLIQDTLPFATFFVAVAIASVVGGVIGGTAALAASLLVATWVWLSPQWALLLPGVLPARSLLFVVTSPTTDAMATAAKKVAKGSVS